MLFGRPVSYRLRGVWTSMASPCRFQLALKNEWAPIGHMGRQPVCRSVSEFGPVLTRLWGSGLQRKAQGALQRRAYLRRSVTRRTTCDRAKPDPQGCTSSRRLRACREGYARLRPSTATLVTNERAFRFQRIRLIGSGCLYDRTDSDGRLWPSRTSYRRSESKREEAAARTSFEARLSVAPAIWDSSSTIRIGSPFACLSPCCLHPNLVQREYLIRTRSLPAVWLSSSAFSGF